MYQLLQNLKSGNTENIEVPVPNAGSGQVLIETSTTLISAGTERMLVEFSQGNLLQKAKSQPDKVKQVLDKIRTDGLLPTLETVFNRLDEPLPLGYCNVGTLSAVNKETAMGDQFVSGDRVVSNGPHAEVVCVPQNLCAKVPDNVSNDEAAFTVIASIGLQGVRLTEPTIGENIVVVGLGLIGLITVQLLHNSGCHVLGIDMNPERLALAEKFGAKTVDISAGADPISAANTWTNGRGVDAVLITASAKTDEIVHQAAQMSRKRGRIVLVGVVGLNLRRSDFYEKELIFQVSCSYGPGRYDEDYEQKGIDYPFGYVRWTEQRNFEAILSMMATGRLDIKPLITHRFAFEKAPEAYEKILKDPSALGVLLDYRSSDNSESVKEKILKQTIQVSRPDTGSVPSEKCVAAMIGAGNFAKMTMAPALAKTQARLKYVSARTNGASAAHIARKYGFENATTDLDAILNDPEVNTVFITTGHDSHAVLSQKALLAGKNVFVEKPLCINLDQLKTIIKTYSSLVYQGSSPQLMVGFNRRFSPHSMKIKELLNSRSEPLAMNFTVNAGVIPPDVWVHDPNKGGGRIIGEACHFIDLLSFFAGSKIISVASVQMGKGVSVKEDKMSIVLSFEDGSIGTVNYFGNGSKSFPKETLEIFSEGRILKLDNFKKIKGYSFKGFKSFKTFKMDKGHQGQFNAYIGQIEKKSEPLISFEDVLNVTLASFAAVTASNEKRTIVLQDEYSNLTQIS